MWIVPYSTVDKSRNLVFTAEQVKKFGDDSAEYLWGTYDGSGEPILKTPADFGEEFLQKHDFAKAPVLGLNTIIKTGNSLENVVSEFPEASFVDLHYPGFTAEAQGIDWVTLRLVFTLDGDSLRLIAIIHCCWTI